MNRSVKNLCVPLVFGILMTIPGLPVCAQQATQPPATGGSPVTFLPHSDTTWWWLSGQANFIEQSHGGFTSPYSGPHSFRATPENALSRVFTLYTGARLPQ